MGRLVLPSYTVTRDTREKQGYGWEFSKSPENKKPPKCLGTVIDYLHTGDYSIKGYEDLVSVERKQDYSELWHNYMEKDTFEKEMERISKFKYKYMLIETSLTSDHFSLSPSQLSKVPGKVLLAWLCRISSQYGINIIPVGSVGKKYCQLIFENVIWNEKDRWVDSSPTH